VLRRIAAIALLVSFVPSTAGAQTVAECSAAYESAQRLRREGRLVSAREQMILCSQQACPAPLRRECTDWMEPTLRAIPSFSVRVLGRDGCDVPNATIEIDGGPAPPASAGRAIEVDPGVHDLRVSIAGEAPIEQKVVLAQGQKDRPIVVRLAPPNVECKAPSASPSTTKPSPPPRLETRPVPVLTYALGGTAIAAFAVSTAFGISAFGQKSDLDACSPRCPHDDADAMRRDFAIADVSLAVGVVALAAAAVVYFTRPTTFVDASR
jgi:hypothetical protein